MVLLIAFDRWRTGCPSTIPGYVFLIAFVPLVLLWIASAIQGLRVSRRGSKGRAVGGVIAIVLVPFFVMILVMPWRSETQPRARIANARATVQSLARAVTMSRERTGKLPARLEELTVVTVDTKGERVGAFLAAVPSPPRCWTSYRYQIGPGDAFTITSSGDGTTARYPER